MRNFEVVQQIGKAIRPFILKGGLRRNAVEKRLREGRPLIPDTKGGLWEDEDFVANVRGMLRQDYPQIPEVLRNDYGDVIEPASPKSGAGAGNSRTSPPASEGASCGGPSAPIDAEMTYAQKQLMIADTKAKTRAMELQAARDEEELADVRARAAIRESGGGPGGATVTGSCREPAGESGILPGAGGDKKVSTIKVSTLRPT